MSGNRRKNTPSKPVNAAADPLAARVVAIPKTSESVAVKTTSPAKTAPERIGEVLRQARLDKNDDLYLIAEYLRIKPAFLIALENSQYDEFPADAYIIGFLRTYANFLGVDGKEAVDRYRYEMAGRRKKPILSMPTPVSEGRTPSAVIMVGATIALVLIYALWYGISSANRAEVNMQPALPTMEQSGASSSVAPSSVSEASAAAGLTAPVTSDSTTASVASTPAPSSVTASTPSEASQPEQAIKDAKKQTAGDTATTSRLTIRATQSSWVMITDDSGKTVFDRVMKTGDAYKVPNKLGLSLTTGNGSGIILSLDGTDLPKVANGAPHVVRNIALDPDHLASELSALDH